MKYLDAEIKPITMKDAGLPVSFAVLMCGAGALMGVLTGHGWQPALQMFPPVLLGALMSEAGLSVVKAPLATLTALPFLYGLYAGTSWLARSIA